MKTRNIIIIAVLAVVVIGGAVAYFMWNKPHKQVEDMKGIAVTATDLCREFSTDETAANKKYLDQAVEVTGTVTGASNNQDGYTLVTLQGEDGSMEVECTMRDKNVQPETNREVTIKGKCSGRTLFGVGLTDCIILK